jgi:hypothetical protein
MRASELLAEVTSPGRAVPYADEEAWCALVDALVSAVREQERATALATLNRLVISARALLTSEAVARLIEGIAARDYSTQADAHALGQRVDMSTAHGSVR